MSDTGILEKLIEKLDLKLDNIQKEINEFKNGISVNLTNLTNRVEITEIKVKNVENVLNKPFKDRILDMILQGIIYSVSCCIGISVFFMLLKGVGGNVIAIFKPLIKAFTGI